MKKIPILLLGSFLLFSASACSNSNAAELSSGPASQTQPIVVAPTPTPSAPATGKITVEMTSASLGDDCGEGVAPAPPAQDKKGSLQEKSSMEADSPSHGGGASAKMAARRACEQTSIQLTITAPTDGVPTDLRVKKVEVFDDKGKLVETLTARSPKFWNAGSYEAWDQKIPPGKVLAVSYPTTAPKWPKVKNRFNRTFTVKVVVTVGGADQALQHDVYLHAEITLPPNVVT